MRAFAYAGLIALVAGAIFGQSDDASGSKSRTCTSARKRPTRSFAPNWLELDRFDVIAKIPADATTDAQKTMLQALLEDRFKLVVHKDTRPLTTWAILTGKQPHLKRADGSGSTGCKLQTASGPPAEGAAGSL